MILPHLSRKAQVLPSHSSYQHDFSFGVTVDQRHTVTVPPSRRMLLRSMNYKLSAYYSPKPQAEITKNCSPKYMRKAFGFAESSREKQHKLLKLTALKHQGESVSREIQQKLVKRKAAEVIERQYGVRFSDLEVMELTVKQLARQAKAAFVSKVTNRAARVIQRYWMGKKLLLQKKALIARQHLCAAKIQRAWKRSQAYLSRKTSPAQAALSIQKVWKGYRARKQLDDLKKKRDLNKTLEFFSQLKDAVLRKSIDSISRAYQRHMLRKELKRRSTLREAEASKLLSLRMRSNKISHSSLTSESKKSLRSLLFH
mmetsp:Transcript_15777/g.28817  ORF Transcript_15777/g.28817 Transcript_15777/m.28817 type:complete len:313 (+) Transcript_15777:105-1043(+)